MVYFMGLSFLFKVRLNGVATFIGIVGLSVAAMVLVALFAR
jgi:Ca2+-transporting ATPase